jgi:hypothetical protein
VAERGLVPNGSAVTISSKVSVVGVTSARDHREYQEQGVQGRVPLASPQRRDSHQTLLSPLVPPCRVSQGPTFFVPVTL